MGGIKQRTLLAVLLLNLNRVVTVDSLVDQLADGDRPVSARAATQRMLSRLRAVLGGGDGERGGLLTRPEGYVLAFDRAQVDLYRFDDLVRRGQRELDAGEVAAAAATLREALALWRGPALTGVAEAVRRAPAVRLEETRLAAWEDRIEADLRLGHHDRLVGELSELVATHPVRERLVGQLMTALYRAGRRGDALETYRRARRRLVEELGLEPGEALQRLHHGVLADDPAVRGAGGGPAGGGAVPAPAAAGPAPAAAGPDVGAAGPAVAVPERGADGPARPVPSQLPLDVHGFTGRGDELRRLDRLVAELDGRGEDQAEDRPTAVLVAAVSGTAGVGKTALAVHWAHRARERFPDGQLYVNLRGFDPSGRPMRPAEALRGFLQALGVQPRTIPADLDGRASLYRSVLAGRRVLVVLDNASDADQVRPLLPGEPGCMAVVTSRDRLLGLVAAEGARPLTLGLLSAAESRELLTRRLDADRMAAEPGAVEEIIGHCAGLPLALAVIAARAATLPAFPLAGLAAQVRDSLDGDEVSTDIRAVFGWSYRVLEPGAARLLRLLSLHPGPDATATAAASLAGLPLAEVRPLLAELTRAHLLAEPEPGRYGMHDLLRADAEERSRALDAGGERRAAAGRMLDHYLHTAHAAALLLAPRRNPIGLAPPDPAATTGRLSDRAEAACWFEREHPVLIAAVEDAAKGGFDRHAWQLAWAIATYLSRQGRWQDLADTQRVALAAAARSGDRAGQVLAHSNLGRALTRLGRYDDAHASFERSLRLAESLRDPIGQASAHLGRVPTFELQGRHADALRHARLANDLYRAAGARGRQAHALNAIGWACAQLGDYQGAVHHCRQALELFDRDDPLGQAVTWDSLGYAQHRLADHAEAIRCYQRALELLAEAGDRYEQASTLERLGDAHAAAGHGDAARRAWRDALDRLEQLGHSRTEALRTKLARLAS